MRETLKFIFISFILICLLQIVACKAPGEGEFEPLYSSYQEILADSGPDYEVLEKKIENLQKKIRIYLKGFPQSKKRSEAERILSETKDMKLKLQQEQFDYSELEKQFKRNPTPYEADTEIDEIKNFIRTYPRSLKRSCLTDRLDELNFKKFQAETAVALNTIPDVNRVVQISGNYMGKIQKKNLKDQVKDKINKTEGQRKTIYRNEFFSKANELLKRMRWQAIEIAKKSHRFSKIESVKETVISGDVSTPVNHVTVVREYNIHMRGAIIGHNRFRLTIQAKGIINGTLQGGVSYSVSEAVKVSDFQIN